MRLILITRLNKEQFIINGIRQSKFYTLLQTIILKNK